MYEINRTRNRKKKRQDLEDTQNKKQQINRTRSRKKKHSKNDKTRKTRNRQINRARHWR